MSYKNLTLKKRKLDKYRPLPEALLRNLEDWFRVELTYTSNAIEGNMLTRAETALVVEKGLTVQGKTLRELIEATNHAHALDWLKKLARKKTLAITERVILDIHEIIMKGIDDTNAGRYRSVSVRISGSTVVLPNSRKVPELMHNFIKWLQANKKKLHPVELAAEAHYQLVSIHPFVDGNGRTAHLLMNLILIMYGYPQAIIRTQDRLAYIKALEKAQLGGSKDDYLQLIGKAVGRSLDIYLDALRNEKTKKIFAEVNEKRQLFKVGELAKKTDVTVSTIRYWTKQKLLEVAKTTPSGYQLYTADMIERIQAIKKLKDQRYTLLEIKQKLQK